MTNLKYLFLAPVFIGIAGSAQAALKVCNESDDTQSVSVGYEGSGGWTSEGWWNVDRGECKTPIGGDLNNRYYYIRAEKKGGPFKGGGYFFCTSTKAFEIVGDSDCEDRGYDNEDFAEIDVGQNTRDFTYTLTQEAMEVAQVGVGPGLEFCNESNSQQTVAIGYEGAEGWTSEGWWNIDPGDCKKPLGGNLSKRYYYYRSEVKAGDFNGQGYSFCTTPEAFEIVGDTNCEGRGYVTEDFSEIDVGDGTKGFRFILTNENGGLTDANVADTGDTGNTSPTGSGFEVCNETNHTQAVSVGYEGSEDWTSEGWWNVDPGECKKPLGGPLDRRYYYYRAEVSGGISTARAIHSAQRQMPPPLWAIPIVKAAVMRPKISPNWTSDLAPPVMC